MFPRSIKTFIVLLGVFPLAAFAADPMPDNSPAATAPEIRTPPAPPTPRINGPRVYGARPTHPFFYHLPVTGERPVTFEAKGLPDGLTLDPATGNVTGAATERSAYSVAHPVEFTATNARGTDQATINLVIGDTICLTPPLGWNSWNHFANRVTEKDVRDAADAMVSSGLIDHGWTYVNIDDCWQGERDAAGNIHGNAKFPDMKALADYVHARGLKFGIYSSPGPKTCAGFAGSYGHEDQDARTYADWGVDYVKYDLCSYGGVIPGRVRERTAALLPEDKRAAYADLNKRRDELQRIKQRGPGQEAMLKDIGNEIHDLLLPLDSARLTAFNFEEQQTPYRVFGQSLAKVPRDIVYSFCQYGNASVWEWAASLGGNSWRTTGDISANWKSMSGIGFDQDRLAKFAGPGHWNDPDMLEIGNQGLTPDECYTHMTLWCMLSAPLLIGCDMSKMDPFTVSLFSNDWVLKVDQDQLGIQGHRIKTEGTTEVWAKPLADGSTAIAFFNRGEQPAKVGITWPEFWDTQKEYHRKTEMRTGTLPVLGDLWRTGIPESESDGISVTVAPHGAELWAVYPFEPTGGRAKKEP